MKATAYKSSGIAWTLFLLFGCAALAGDDRQAAELVEQAVHLQADAARGKEVYLMCVGCHQPEGWGSEDGAYPQIAGQLPGAIIKQMADIRARNRDTPTMLPFTMLENLSVQEIADVAAYVAQLPMIAPRSTGSGAALAQGAQLYRERCAECHGDRGQGEGQKRIPMIQGQHFRYLARQIDWIRTGKRRNGDEKMLRSINDLSPTETEAVLDFVSRLRPPEARLARPGWYNGDFPKFVRNEPLPSTDVCKIVE